MDVMRVLATALTMATACTNATSKDDELRDRLVGKWAEARHFAIAREQQSIELSGDGRIRIERTYHDASGTSRTVLQGKWRVENGDFVYHTSESCGSAPDAISVECRQRIVAVTDWEWVMEEARGEPEFRAWRYPR
jgi:hypothetical protein